MKIRAPLGKRLRRGFMSCPSPILRPLAKL
jgi:hypothetical protein